MQNKVGSGQKREEHGREPVKGSGSIRKQILSSLYLQALHCVVTDELSLSITLK